MDHRFIKKITRPTLGFKAFHSASTTLAGIEVAHDQKETIPDKSRFTIQTVASLAA